MYNTQSSTMNILTWFTLYSIFLLTLLHPTTSFSTIGTITSRKTKMQPQRTQSTFVSKQTHHSKIVVTNYLTNSPSEPDPPKEQKAILDWLTGPQSRRALLISSSLALTQFYFAQAYAPSNFKRIPTQFIAALGDPNASSGSNANDWGLWTVDPGPRGVFLDDYPNQFQKIKKKVDSDGESHDQWIAPAGWTFSNRDWWLEEHGLIMEAPTFPVPPGKYLVTGGRSTTTTLTIEPPDSATGEQRWKLGEDDDFTKPKLYDVTHLPCRSARYSPISTIKDGKISQGSPATANKKDFPVRPGAPMPNVSGCNKLDYAVIFLIGKAV